MSGFFARLFGDSYYYENDSNVIEPVKNNLDSYNLNDINVEYIRGVAELDDYDWFIKIILDKVKSNTLVFIDLQSIKGQEERYELKSKIREKILRLNGSFRDLRVDQNLCLVASEEVSNLIEDVGVHELNLNKKIKIAKNLKLDVHYGSMLSNILDSYANDCTLIVDLSSEEVENLRRDTFNCLLGASMVIKGSYRSVDSNQNVFVFAPGNPITSFDNFG